MKFAKLLAVLAAASLVPSWAAAAERVGRVIAVSGKPKVERASGGLLDLHRNDPIHLGDVIQTGNGQAKLMFEDNTLMTLDRRTELKITQYLYEPQKEERSSLLDLVKGKVKTLVGSLFAQETDFKIRTPTAVAGVRGTFFMIGHFGDTEVTVFDGTVGVEDSTGAVFELGSGLSVGISTNGFQSDPQQLDPQTLNRMANDLEIRDQEGLNDSADNNVDQGRLLQESSGLSGNLGGPLGGQPTADAGPTVDDGTFESGSVVGNPLEDLQPVDPAVQGNVGIRFTFPREAQ